MQLTQVLSGFSFDVRLRNLLIVVSTSIFFAMSAWISIPLPFTPVPVSFTSQLILMASILLGQRGTYATLLYLGQGIVGFPVFANGGFGLAYLFGPTGGYLIGLAIASYILGTFADQMRGKGEFKAFSLMLFGNFMIYLFGIFHLALLMGLQKALLLGFCPFIATDILKLTFALKGLQFFAKSKRSIF